MKLKKLEVLSKEEIETITSSALRILETIGIKIDDEKTASRIISTDFLSFIL